LAQLAYSQEFSLKSLFNPLEDYLQEAQGFGPKLATENDESRKLSKSLQNQLTSWIKKQKIDCESGYGVLTRLGALIPATCPI
jgi:hypothetical protein